MEIMPHSDTGAYTVEMSEEERRALVDGMTNLSLDLAKGTVDHPDHDGRGAPTADLLGGYQEAHEIVANMANTLKEGY